MKIVFLSNHMKFSGGRWLMFEYAKFLAGHGHGSRILVQSREGELAASFEAELVPAFDAANVPECDLLVATSPDEAEKAYRCGKGGKVVHFCQGFDLIDMEHRMAGRFIPPRYEGKGFRHWLRLLLKKRQWRRTFHKWDRIYRLPTYFISVSQHLTEELERRYGRPAPLCRNGVNLELFKADTKWRAPEFSAERPMRIANVGPYNVTYKGIPTSFAALRRLREKGLPFELVRLTKEPCDFDRAAPFKIELHENPDDARFAEILRSCDIYLSNSTEREGFGLPAMQAMASGLVAVLSDIQCYRSFDRERDFAIFVPEGDVGATVAALERVYHLDTAAWADLRSTSLAVSSSFSHAKACERFEELLLEIAAVQPAGL